MFQPVTLGENSPAASGILIFANQTVQAGDTIGNTTAPTLFATTFTLPAASVSLGQLISINYHGVYGNNLDAATIKLDLMANSTTLISGTSGATAGHPINQPWEARCDMLCVAEGASGLLEVQGMALFIVNANTVQSRYFGNTSSVAFDTTIDNVIGLEATWGTQDVNDTITLRMTRVVRYMP